MISIKNRLILFWKRLWIRKDEFHSSLDFDAKIASKMSRKERTNYAQDLTQRRREAHEKDLFTEGIEKK